MKKKLFKYIKIFVSMALILSLVAPSYASLSASDGSAFVTKAEFDSALADFNARLTTFEAGINSKIDSQVTSYLDRNGIWSGKAQPCITELDLVPSDYQTGINLINIKKWGLTMNASNGPLLKSGLCVMTWTFGTSACVFGIIGSTNPEGGFSSGEAYHYCHGYYQTHSPWESPLCNWNTNYVLSDSVRCLYMEDKIGYPNQESFYTRDEHNNYTPYDTGVPAKGEVSQSLVTQDFKDATGIQFLRYVIKEPVATKTAYFFVEKGKYLSFCQYVYASNSYYSTPTTAWPGSTNTYFTTNYKCFSSTEIANEQSCVFIDNCVIY